MVPSLPPPGFRRFRAPAEECGPAPVVRIAHLLQLLVAALVAAGATLLAADPPPSRTPSWRELVLDGRKLGVEASISVRSSLVLSDQAAGAWLPTAAASVVRPGGPEVLLLVSQTTFAGRVFDERLWLDPGTRAAIQIDDTETGARNQRKVHRLLAGGFLFEQRLPVRGEESRLPSAWSDLHRSAERFPPALPASAVVTGALALVGSDVLASLRAPGDRVTCLVLVQSQIEEVTVSVVSKGPTTVGLVEHRNDGDHTVSGPIETLTLELSSRPVDEKASGSFRLFGLEHGILVLWDPGRRVPLRISGQVHLLGKITINLEEIRY